MGNIRTRLNVIVISEQDFLILCVCGGGGVCVYVCFGHNCINLCTILFIINALGVWNISKGGGHLLEMIFSVQI